MKNYIVRHKSDSVGAPCWDKESVFEYAVFGPCLTFAYGEVVALFVKEEHAEHFAATMNLKDAIQQIITEMSPKAPEMVDCQHCEYWSSPYKCKVCNGTGKVPM